MNRLPALAVAFVAAWLGIMAFFSFAAAPGVFQALDRRTAGEAVAALLPAYYRWGITLSALAVGALVIVAARARAGRARHITAAALGGLMAALLAWALAVTLPAAEDARRARDDRRFAAAHRNAVRLNLVVMLCAATFVAVETLMPTGRRDG